jgi:hypothetical protein
MSVLREKIKPVLGLRLSKIAHIGAGTCADRSQVRDLNSRSMEM